MQRENQAREGMGLFGSREKGCSDKKGVSTEEEAARLEVQQAAVGGLGGC